MRARPAVERFPGRPDLALYLAALHRDVDRAQACIAGDDLEARAEHAVERAREDAGVLRDRGGANHGLSLHRVFNGSYLRRAVPDCADRNRARGAADPIEPRGLKIRLWQLEERRQHESAGDEAPGGAVLRTDALDEARCLDPA